MIYGRAATHPKGRHRTDPKRRITNSAHKNVILSLVERGGKVRSFHVESSTVSQTAYKQTKQTGGKLRMKKLDPQPLPKEELPRHYAITHKFVHRGTLRNLLSSPTSIDLELNAPEIIGWAQKIIDHLAVHTIAIDEKQVIICSLRNSFNQAS